LEEDIRVKEFNVNRRYLGEGKHDYLQIKVQALFNFALLNFECGIVKNKLRLYESLQQLQKVL